MVVTITFNIHVPCMENKCIFLDLIRHTKHTRESGDDLSLKLYSWNYMQNPHSLTNTKSFGSQLRLF